MTGGFLFLGAIGGRLPFFLFVDFGIEPTVCGDYECSDFILLSFGGNLNMVKARLRSETPFDTICFELGFIVFFRRCGRLIFILQFDVTSLDAETASAYLSPEFP